MKKLILVMVVIIMTLLVNISNEQNTIIVYSSMEQFRREGLQQQLSEKFPDLHVMVMYVPTAKAVAKIPVEQEQSDADIVIGLGTSYMEKIRDQLTGTKEKSHLQHLDGLAPKDRGNAYVAWERQIGAFIISTGVLKKRKLSKLKTCEGLLDRKYHNPITMSDPKSSSTDYSFYKNLMNTMGEAEALAYIDQPEFSVKQLTESDSGPIKLFTQGKVGINLGLAFQAVNQVNTGSPFKVIYPKGSSPCPLTGIGLMKRHADDPGVQRAFDFIINDFLLYDKEHFSLGVILKDQENTIQNYPIHIPYASTNGIEDIHKKERLLDLWKYQKKRG